MAIFFLSFSIFLLLFCVYTVQVLCAGKSNEGVVQVLLDPVPVLQLPPLNHKYWSLSYSYPLLYHKYWSLSYSTGHKYWSCPTVTPTLSPALVPVLKLPLLYHKYLPAQQLPPPYHKNWTLS